MKGLIFGLLAAIGAFPLANFATRLLAAAVEALGQGYGESIATLAPVVGLGCAITAFHMARKKYGNRASG